jgi:hypothetical protein
MMHVDRPREAPPKAGPKKFRNLASKSHYRTRVIMWTSNFRLNSCKKNEILASLALDTVTR